MGDAQAHDEIISGQGRAVEVPLGGPKREEGYVLGEDAELEIADEEEEAEPRFEDDTPPTPDEEPKDGVEVKEGGAEEPKPKPRFVIPSSQGSGVPAWARMPKGLKVPRGRQLVFMCFPSEWTDTPNKGHEIPALLEAGFSGIGRECICWSLSDNDEKWAVNRAAGDPNRALGMFAKQMIRAIDGVKVNWANAGTGGPGDVEQWMNELGGRCRQMITRLYSQMHVLKPEEMQLFFEHFVAVRSVG